MKIILFNCYYYLIMITDALLSKQNVTGTLPKHLGICMRPIQKNNGTQYLSKCSKLLFIFLSKQTDSEQIYSMCFANAINQGIWKFIDRLKKLTK